MNTASIIDMPNGLKSRVGIIALATISLAGCTFVLREPVATSACGEFRYEVNAGSAGADQIAAVKSAARRFGELIDREVVFVGLTDASTVDMEATAAEPVLIQFSWPDDAPTRFGFAEPLVRDGRLVGGFILLHPMLEEAPPDIVERVTMHELGHLGGLAHVNDVDEIMNPKITADDWGPGDIIGLNLTHARCDTSS